MVEWRESENLAWQFENYLQTQVAGRLQLPYPGGESLTESTNYSLFSGGKRFRPMLVLMTGRSLGVDASRLLPFAAAVEMVHTYSLIHDDLPAMDNDYIRRGRPTNHIIFGEATALLAGDALLTEAFALLAEEYKFNPSIAIKLVGTLAGLAGFNGMVGGQALDLSPRAPKDDTKSLLNIHLMKTAALIKACVMGAGVIAGRGPQDLSSLEKFGELLGVSFQITDDMHDFQTRPNETTNLVALMGKDQTLGLLKQYSEQALAVLELLGLNDSPLTQLVHYNQNRTT